MAESKDLIQAIQRQAILKWGEKAWRAEIARATVEIMRRSDPTATYENRRKQIYRVFEANSCTVDTLLHLVEAIDCKLQLTCTETKIIEL